MKVSIIPMDSGHGEAVRRIYEEGIATGIATFETEAPEWDKWDRAHLANCRLVALRGRDVIARAALSPVSDRCAYGGVAEVSVYVAADARGQGVGKRLLEALIGGSEQSGFWTLQAGMFADNTTSIALHKVCGFVEVGVRQGLGRLHGAWRDVMLLERRSKVVGV